MSAEGLTDLGLLLPMIVFLFTFALEFVSVSFKSGLANKLFCMLLPGHSELESLKAELASLKQDLAAVSPQGDFVRWAKTQRLFNKKSTELQALTEIKDARVAAVRSKVSVASWLLQALLVLAFRTTPMFFLPQGWFQPISWLLSFPFSPTGSVGIVFWMMVSRGVCSSVFASFLA